MKETDISEELWFKYLEGRTTEEETERLAQMMAEDEELLSEYLSVREAMLRTDADPCCRPDLDLAQKQINQLLNTNTAETKNVVMLTHRPKVRKLFAVAAVMAVLIGVALFLLFRPDHFDNNLAQQEQKIVESVEEVRTQSPETAFETEHTDRTRKNSKPSINDTEGVKTKPDDFPQETYTTKKIEKNYATSQVANSLTVTKPNKENYRVLCKNLEKTLDFQWSATNVQTLQFVLTDSKGKTFAETNEVAADHCTLKYSEIYPEQKLSWSLVVTFKDGLREKRNGQIQIDYYH